MEISCCPVAVQFGIQVVILAVHLKSFSVEAYGVEKFFIFIFFVAFLEIHVYYRYKKNRV